MTPEKAHFQEKLLLNKNTPEQLEKLKNDLKVKVDTLKADGSFSGEDLADLVDLLDDETILSPTEAELKSHLESLQNLETQIDFLMALVDIGGESGSGVENGVTESKIEIKDKKNKENITNETKNFNKYLDGLNEKIEKSEIFTENIDNINKFEDLIDVYNYLIKNKDKIEEKKLSLGENTIKSLNNTKEYINFINKITDKIQKSNKYFGIEEIKNKRYLKVINEKQDNSRRNLNNSNNILNNSNNILNNSKFEGEKIIINNSLSGIKNDYEESIKLLESGHISENTLKTFLIGSDNFEIFNNQKENITNFLKTNNNFLININQVKNINILNELINIVIKIPEKNILNLGGIQALNLNNDFFNKVNIENLIQLTLNFKNKNLGSDSIFDLIKKYSEIGGDINKFSYLKEIYKEGKFNKNEIETLEISIIKFFDSSLIINIFGEDIVDKIKQKYHIDGIKGINEDETKEIQELLKNQENIKRIEGLLRKGNLTNDEKNEILKTKGELVKENKKEFYIYDKIFFDFIKENINNTEGIKNLFDNKNGLGLDINKFPNYKIPVFKLTENNPDLFKFFIDKNPELLSNLRRNFSDNFLVNNKDFILSKINNNNNKGEFLHNISNLLPLGENLVDDIKILKELKLKGINFSNLISQDRDKILINFLKNIAGKDISEYEINTQKIIVEVISGFEEFKKNLNNDKIENKNIQIDNKINEINNNIESKLTKNNQSIINSFCQNLEKKSFDIFGYNEEKSNNGINIKTGNILFIKEGNNYTGFQIKGEKINISNINDNKGRKEIINNIKNILGDSDETIKIIENFLNLFSETLDKYLNSLKKDKDKNNEEISSILYGNKKESEKTDLFLNELEKAKKDFEANPENNGKKFNLTEYIKTKNPNISDDNLKRIIELIEGNNNISEQEEQTRKTLNEVNTAKNNVKSYLEYISSGYSGSFEDYVKENKIPLKNEKGEIINQNEIGFNLENSGLKLEDNILSNKNYSINLENGNFKDKSGKEIKLSEEEINLVKKSPETAKNIINLYESLERVGLTKLWNYKEDIFKSLENVFRIQFDRKDGNYLDERETKILLNAVLTSLGEKPIKTDKKIDNFLSEVENINGRQVTGAEKEVNKLGESRLEASFIEKFVGRGDMIGFKQSAFEDSLKKIN